MDIKHLLVGVFIVSLSLVANGEEIAAPAVTNSNAWYVGVGRVGIDSETALKEGVDDSATQIKFGWTGQKNSIVYGAGFTYIQYSDNEDFSQVVQNNNDRVYTEDSNASASAFYGEGGYSYALSEMVAFDVVGGIEIIVSSERTIESCSDCRSEDIDISSGLYVMPRIRFMPEGGFTIAVSYQQYLGGDLTSAPMVTLGWTY